jgi:peptidoglycan hydrolase CwlO-like protein
MRKQFIAFLAAFIITAIVALSMLAVGVSAAVNPNGVTASNSSTAQSVSSTTNDQSQVAELQNLIAQYQSREQQYLAREQQYQAAIDSANQQLSQASQEVQMAEQVLVALQNRGLIRIDNQGQITVTQNRGD